MKTRYLALLLVLALVAVLIAGCTQTPTTTTGSGATTTKATTKATTTTGTGSTTKDDTIYELTYYQTASAYQGAYGPFTPENTAYLAWIRDTFGISITATERKDNADQELQLLWATGDLPNIFNVNDSWLQKMCDEDELLALDKFYEDPERYPNLYAVPELYRAFGKYEGTQFCFFGGQSETPDRFDGEYSQWTMVIKPIYEEIGIDIKTYDDLKNFCQAVLDEQYTVEGGSKVYPFGGSTVLIDFLFARMFGLDSNQPVVMTQDGKWVPSWATEEKYQSMKAINELWRAGYFDPETFSQDAGTLNTKIRNSQIALFVGSYGEADAYMQNGASLPNVDDQWTWYEEYGAIVISKISGNSKALGMGYSVFPTNRMVLSAATPDGAAAKFADFAEWRYTEEGMFSDVYEGWPGETWKYNEQGKAIPYYSWWPEPKDPKYDFMADSEASKVYVTGPYWQILNRFQNCLGPTPVRLVMEKGTLRKINIWWNWLRNYTVPVLHENSQMMTPYGAVSKTQAFNEINANMVTIYDSWKAQIWTAASEAAFESAYTSMINELLATNVETYLAEFNKGWATTLQNNPDIESLKFPKQATPISQITGLIK